MSNDMQAKFKVFLAEHWDILRFKAELLPELPAERLDYVNRDVQQVANLAFLAGHVAGQTDMLGSVVEWRQ